MFTQKGTKVRVSELMSGCHLRKGYQLFYEKGGQTMQYVKTLQGKHIQPVTNIFSQKLESCFFVYPSF